MDGWSFTKLLCPWDSPDKNTGVACHSLLQRIFPTQGLNLGLCIAGRFFTIWVIRKSLCWYKSQHKCIHITADVYGMLNPTALLATLIHVLSADVPAGYLRVLSSGCLSPERREIFPVTNSCPFLWQLLKQLGGILIHSRPHVSAEPSFFPSCYRNIE